MNRKNPFEDFDGLDSEKRGARVEAWLRSAKSELTSLVEARVVPRPNDREWDLRGKLAGRAARLEIDESPAAEIYVQVELPFGWHFVLIFDPDLHADREPPPDSDWPNASKRIFLGPHIYVHGDNARAEAAAFGALPNALRTALLEAMPEHRIRYVRVYGYEIWILFWPNLDEMPNPTSTIATALAFADRILRAIDAHGPIKPDDDAVRTRREEFVTKQTNELTEPRPMVCLSHAMGCLSPAFTPPPERKGPPRESDVAEEPKPKRPWWKFWS